MFKALVHFAENRLARYHFRAYASNFVQRFCIYYGGMGAFRTAARLEIGLYWVIRRLLRARLCISQFRSRLGGGDWFDDWVVGHQFGPN
jgi:hypothetical protein